MVVCGFAKHNSETIFSKTTGQTGLFSEVVEDKGLQYFGTRRKLDCLI